MDKIYLDNAGTTRVRDNVLKTMSSFFSTNFDARTTEKILSEARQRIIELLGASQYDVFFTSCGSEANNIALNVMADLIRKSAGRRRIFYTAIEHASIYRTVESNAFEDFERIRLAVDRIGMPLHHNEIDGQGGAATMMYVNNEIGSILPVYKWIDTFKSANILTHVDAVQALGHIKLTLDILGADFVTLSAHKIHGPKGLGILLVKHELAPFVEQILRCYTINMPYVMGFVTALEARYKAMTEHLEHAAMLKTYIITRLKQIHQEIKIIGFEAVDSEKSVSAIINVQLPYLEGDSIVIGCDMAGIAVSSGSACSSGTMQASHVIKALGFSEAEAKRCFRISTSDFTTVEEVDRMLEVLCTMLEPFEERERNDQQ
ncbi:aminotransferase class V-fold PLP-dependent enzyme [Fusibacter paucivorans]|uniref:Aminotransferase class V-fold PLP-dependent enzyme n=1 Tax=Fusibacter paucivorans TaxID=76009 RepID=A0ABS5PQH5_9FIRM|nr:aminotransferase class V-fold PLP-dependent enzyme [Fusibacter paucivorans]MBS7526626.1 aminotransferase class V-fold PLP-dependent enzyme [Fusibacter paucivorans]